MLNISKIDPNFAVGTNLNCTGLRFRDCREEPFSIHGLIYENNCFRRIPEEVAKTVSSGVYNLHVNCAGGRVRFRTDSAVVAISARMTAIGKMAHFAFAGSIGFDLYADNVYAHSYVPPVQITDGYEASFNFGVKKEREIMIDFPLYSGVVELFIGLDEDAVVCAPKPYTYTVPAVFYGSSITQGGCASRPGTCYQAPLSREFDFDYFNLGFSGSARAEDTMIEYLAGLNMSAFFLDYDHNSPSTEHLQATHEKLFCAVREAHPDLPIIMMSRPKHILSAVEEERLEIIRTTYEHAVAAGDRKVWLMDGAALTALCGNEGTVDKCHPTDYGFASMAKALSDLLHEIKIYG